MQLSENSIELAAKFIVSFIPLVVLKGGENAATWTLLWMQTSPIIISGISKLLLFFQSEWSKKGSLPSVTIRNGTHVGCAISWYVHTFAKPKNVKYNFESLGCYRLDDCPETELKWKSHTLKVATKEKKVDKWETKTFIEVTCPKLETINDFLTDVEIQYNKFIATSKSIVDSWFYDNQNSEWCKKALQTNKSLENYFIDNDLKQRLITDIQRFIDDEAYYKKLGLPYKRGIMIHGLPGSGKTSLQYVLAEHFKRDIVGFDTQNMTNKFFRSAVRTINPYSIIGIDDIDKVDCFVVDDDNIVRNSDDEDKQDSELKSEDESLSDGKRIKRKRKSKNKTNDKLEIKTILEVFDGYEFLHGCIVVFTANDISKVNPFLMRAGRTDVVVELGLPSLETVNNMLEKVFPEEHDKDHTWMEKARANGKSRSKVVMSELLYTHVIPNRFDYLKSIHIVESFLE
jgi:phage FluMu protein Com